MLHQVTNLKQTQLFCSFSDDKDSFERQKSVYINASNELQRTKEKLQELQVR